MRILDDPDLRRLYDNVGRVLPITADVCLRRLDSISARCITPREMVDRPDLLVAGNTV